MEVLLVLAIISIMTGAVLSYVGQSNHNTELETVANEIVASIRKIQNYSLSGKEVTPGCAKYRFIAVSGTNSFTIDNGGGATCSFNEVHQLKNAVTFSSNVNLEFNVPFGNRSITNPVDITITKNSNNNYHICVTGVGVITMQKASC